MPQFSDRSFMSGPLGMGMENKDKSGVTLATVGLGEIITQSDIKDLNRDISKMQIVLKDSSFDFGFNVAVPNFSKQEDPKDPKIKISTLDKNIEVIEKLDEININEPSSQTKK